MAEDDGTYLTRIDPLGGQWRVERLGQQDFTRFNAWINFTAGGFLNHGAGCGGGYPAFYRQEENRVSVTRLEKVQIGKCASSASPTRALAIDSERRLASFLDQVVSWSRPGERMLLLTDSSGQSALLTRPTETHPEIAGRWLIESINGKALATERRPATLSISMDSIGVHADCNSIGGRFTVPTPGRIAVTGSFISTLIGCSTDDAAEDALMSAAISGATAFRVDGEKLIFTGSRDMVVRRPSRPDRRLAGEYAACGDTLLGAYHEGPITLVIDGHRGKIAVAGAGMRRSITPYIPGALPTDNHPTVGDWLLADKATLLPTRVLGRMNLFKRRAPGDPSREQMIAANIDTLFIVASCNQDFSVARLERYLVLAREVGVNPVVVLTKNDLTEASGEFATAVRAIEPGLLVHTVNGLDPDSAACLTAFCGVGKTVALLGSSGVGKSTLVNTLRGSDSIATQAIRASDDTGRHTTTVREMHRLERGGWLLDTPGMRELQLSDAATGISEVFDDFLLAAQDCRFSDCAHGGEPGCNVRSAIADGKLTLERFNRWRRLAVEDVVRPAYLTKRR